MNDAVAPRQTRTDTLTVEDFFDTQDVCNLDELVAVLSRRSEPLDSNAFSMAPAQASTPFLGIFVKGDRAVLNYIAESGDCALSQGEPSCGITSFYETRAGGTMDVPTEAIVPIEVAVDAAREFFQTRARPTCVEWLAL